MNRAIVTILIFPALMGCSDGGEGYPALVPENTIVTDQSLSPDPSPALYAQADALRARAAAIRAQTP